MSVHLRSWLLTVTLCLCSWWEFGMTLFHILSWLFATYYFPPIIRALDEHRRRRVFPKARVVTLPKFTPLKQLPAPKKCLFCGRVVNKDGDCPVMSYPPILYMD